MLQAKERALIPYFFDVLSLDSHLSPLRNLGVRHKCEYEVKAIEE
jgi:hypothetical protein